MQQNSERADALLAMKELMRQFEAMRRRVGNEALDEALSRPGLMRECADLVEQLRSGQISQDQAEVEKERLQDYLEEQVQQVGDPVASMQIRAENEAQVKGLSGTAQLLVTEKMRKPNEGV
jgi:hypothetical protein